MAHNSTDLIVEDTNSSTEDNGSTDVGFLTFKNDQFLAPLIGLVASVVTLIIVTALNLFSSWGAMGQLGISTIWLWLVVIYMIFFVIGKPPRYQWDVWHRLRYGGNIETRGRTPFLGPLERRWFISRQHPRLAIKRRQLTRTLHEQGYRGQELKQAVEDSMNY